MNVPKKAAAGNGNGDGLARVARQGFKLELDATFDIAIYAGSVWVGLFAGSPDPLHITQVPLDRFESEDEARAWALETVEMFEQNWRDVMAFETARHFNNIGRFHLYEMGRTSYSSIDKLIAAQVKQLEKNLREWFHRPTGRGHRSKWSSKELADALLEILTERPALSWDALREELQTREPDKTPASGGALRVLAGRFDLKLRTLQKEAAKRKRKREREDAKREHVPRNAG